MHLFVTLFETKLPPRTDKISVIAT